MTMQQTQQVATVPPVSASEPSVLFRKMLDILHRGGTYAYYWNVIGLTKRTTWFNVGHPKQVVNGVENAYFGVHPTTKIPDLRHDRKTGKQYTPRPENVRAVIDEVASVNCFFGEFDRKDGNTLETVLSLTPEPSIIIDSGGGWHCYWLLRDTWHLSDTETRQSAKEAQYAWVDYVGSDKEAIEVAA